MGVLVLLELIMGEVTCHCRKLDTMGKNRRRGKCSTRSFVYGILIFVGFLITIYEIAIFCVLDDASHVTRVGKSVSFQPKISRLVDSPVQVDVDKVLHEFAGFREARLAELGKNVIPNSVHYVWCENRTFDFRNYLSVMSVWKTLRPDSIEFHYQSLPKQDKYDDWFDDIKKTIPGFSVREIPKNWDGDDMGCGFWFGLAVIEDRGGIFIGNNVIVTEAVVRFLEHERTFVFSTPTKDITQISVAMGKHHDDDFKSFRRKFSKSQIAPNDALLCDILDRNRNISGNELCYVLNEPLNPADEYQTDTKFGEIVRKLMYGYTDKKVGRGVLPGTIPKIVHYVWFGIKELDFMMFLSMLSTLFILNPDKVYIHTDGGLSGRYFDRIIKDKRVVLVFREKPLTIFGHRIMYAQHRSDIVRAECLLRFGGIYMDWDVLWLKAPDDLIETGYDVIANFDHMQQGNFPNTINLGVLMAKPKATFIKRWQDALINYKSEDFLYNAVELPYKIYEKYPDFIHIERHLQVMCFRLKCHPTFHPDFKNFMEDQPFDWRKDVYSIHFTFPDPDELTNETRCKNGNGRFAEIGRFILQHEHKLPSL